MKSITIKFPPGLIGTQELKPDGSMVISVEREGKKKRQPKVPVLDVTFPSKDYYDIYTGWYQDKFSEPFGKLDEREFAGLKRIYEYMAEVIRKKGTGLTAEKTCSLFKVLLAKYDLWDPYFQKQLKPTQIASNIASIIANIKNPMNGTGKLHRALQERKVLHENYGTGLDSKPGSENQHTGL